MELKLWNQDGKSVGTVQVQDLVFGASSNRSLVHQVVVGQLANSRTGTVSTKGRSNVSGGGRKPRPQKGMGMARQGSIRAPHFRGGGVVFGPTPRDFGHDTPRKMRQNALRSSLSDKVRSDQLIIVDKLKIDSPKTSQIIAVLNALGAGDRAILVADGSDEALLKSARNISGLRMLPTNLLNTLDVVKHRKIIMTLDAVRIAENLWGQQGVRGSSEHPTNNNNGTNS